MSELSIGRQQFPDLVFRFAQFTIRVSASRIKAICEKTNQPQDWREHKSDDIAECDRPGKRICFVYVTIIRRRSAAPAP